jgi:Tol biopolymer transport system component
MSRLLLALALLGLAGCQAAVRPDTSATPIAAGVQEPLPTAAASVVVASSPPSEMHRPGRIAFDRSNGRGGFDLYLVDADGGNLRHLAPGDLQVPRWSPDGDWIAVAGPRPDGSRVLPVLVHPDGSGLHVLEPDPTLSMGVGAWTPDGSQIAFESWDDADASRAGIDLVSAVDGKQVRRLVDRPAIPGGFSADGTRFALAIEDGSDRQLLGILDVAGGGLATGSDNVGAYPGFMPGGETVYDTIDGKIGVFDLDGTLVRTIRAPGGDVNEARLSPDGERFVFMYLVDDGPPAIASMKVDGSELRVVVPAFGDEQVAPDWQP